MAASIIECLDSPQGGPDSIKLHYVVKDTAEYLEAYNLAYGTSPLTFHGVPRANPPIDLKPITQSDWDATVNYNSKRGSGSQDNNPGDVDFGFDLTMETTHITHARVHLGRYAAEGETAPNFGTMIGYDGQAVQGCDIGVPKCEFHEKWYLPYPMINNPTYRQTLSSMVGTVNLSGWRGNKAGELLFTGVTGSDRGDGTWALDFKFGFSADAVNLVVDGITIPHKQGWEHVWIYYRDRVLDIGDGKKVLAKRAVAAYLNQVYPLSDFADLGIGGEPWHVGTDQHAWIDAMIPAMRVAVAEMAADRLNRRDW